MNTVGCYLIVLQLKYLEGFLESNPIALSIDPNSVDSLISKENALLQQGKNTEAEQLNNNALSIEPGKFMDLSH
jgi:hypothetical protein